MALACVVGDMEAWAIIDEEGDAGSDVVDLFSLVRPWICELRFSFPGRLRLREGRSRLAL